MTGDIYHIKYLNTRDSSLSALRGLVQDGLDNDWKNSRESKKEGLLYNGSLNDYTLQWHPQNEVLNDLIEHRQGSITFWKDDIDFTISLHTQWDQFPQLGGISISFDSSHYRNKNNLVVTEVISEISATVYSHVDAGVTFSFFPIDGLIFSEEKIGLKKLPKDVYWLMIIPPDLQNDWNLNKIEDAWLNKMLEDGSNLVILTENPNDYTAEIKSRYRKLLGFV